MSRESIVKEEVSFVRHPRAKRYIVRVDSRGKIVLTLPRRGSEHFALGVANQHRDWVRERQSAIESEIAASERGFTFGDTILFRGERYCLEFSKDCGRPVLGFENQRLFIADEGMDLRRPLRSFLVPLAKKEFPPRLREFADEFELSVNRVTVREQKTRWGSCSSNGTISLNWRLIQAPPEVLEYVMIHELMHFREMNHSQRFWSLVEAACPNYESCKKWLVDHQSELSW